MPHWITHTLVLLSAIALSSCASPQRGEPRSTKAGPIKIDGTRYKVVKTETGKMSWYSVKTNRGTQTASGERFTNHGKTAAHKHLKMGTLVRVTNLRNGKSRIVRINDRGPYTPGRIIDVSVGMAHQKHLDFHRHGVVPCKVEVLAPLSR